MTKPFSPRDRARSFVWAWRGLRHAVCREHNLWIHLVASGGVLCAGFFLHISPSEWIAILLTSGLVISAEVMNAAVERLTDLVSPAWGDQAGLVKDLAAGSVLVAAGCAFVVGLVIFVPKLLPLLGW